MANIVDKMMAREMWFFKAVILSRTDLTKVASDKFIG